MKTKKALAGLLGLFGSFPAFFAGLLAPTLLVFNLTKFNKNKQNQIQRPQKQTNPPNVIRDLRSNHYISSQFSQNRNENHNN
jgi:hypothetical protein